MKYLTGENQTAIIISLAQYETKLAIIFFTWGDQCVLCMAKSTGRVEQLLLSRISTYHFDNR